MNSFLLPFSMQHSLSFPTGDNALCSDFIFDLVTSTLWCSSSIVAVSAAAKKDKLRYLVARSMMLPKFSCHQGVCDPRLPSQAPH